MELRDKDRAPTDRSDSEKRTRKWRVTMSMIHFAKVSAARVLCLCKMGDAHRLLGKLRHKLERKFHLNDPDHIAPPPPQQHLTPTAPPQPSAPRLPVEQFDPSASPPPPMKPLQVKAWELFGEIYNGAAPSPTQMWSPELRRSPMPTNTFWLNYVLNNGSVPEYVHPYLVQSTPGSVTVCYPSRTVAPNFIFQAFVADLTINHGRGSVPHSVSGFGDLSVTLSIPGKGVKVPLTRGSPYVTMVLKDGPAAPIVFSTIHAFLDVQPSCGGRKHRVSMNNGQTWLLYSTAPVELVREGTSRLRSSSAVRTTVLRVALLPVNCEGAEQLLDEFSESYAVSGYVTFDRPFEMGFHWKRKGGSGDLLLLTLPIHRSVMVNDDECSELGSQERSTSLQYASIDGTLVGYVGSNWKLKVSALPAAVHSFSGGIHDERSKLMVKKALDDDVARLTGISTTSSYFYGKAVARAARMALIAEEIGYQAVVPRVVAFLKDSLTPWLDGTFVANGIGYDSTWGGLISKAGSRDPGADYGIANYNDHHYHWGYFVYTAAVLARFDRSWGSKWRLHIQALVEDYMSVTGSSSFPRLRNFDPWVLHSWAGGLVEFADGRNQESTSEATNAYYAAAMVGMAFGDVGMVNHGLTLAAFEAHAARWLWHIPSAAVSGDSVYEQQFAAENRFVGVLWANKRDAALWFAGVEARECRLGIQVLPITPLTEVLFPDGRFAKDAVDWAWSRTETPGVGDGWKGFVYALLAVAGDVETAVKLTTGLKDHDDGNSLSNMLWWMLSRPGLVDCH